MSAVMIPPILPSAAIREALESGALETAVDLISRHERDVRSALSTTTDTIHDFPGWQTLLKEQRELLEQLQGARSEASDALQRLHGNRRGVEAYRSGGQV